MDRNINSVRQYYQSIRDRLSNYIKSDYLANSEIGRASCRERV